MGTAEPNLEEFFEEKKRVRNPLVPVGKIPFSILNFPLIICFLLLTMMLFHSILVLMFTCICDCKVFTFLNFDDMFM